MVSNCTDVIHKHDIKYVSQSSKIKYLWIALPYAIYRNVQNNRTVSFESQFYF